jgi:hypothetical protein
MQSGRYRCLKRRRSGECEVQPPTIASQQQQQQHQLSTYPYNQHPHVPFLVPGRRLLRALSSPRPNSLYHALIDSVMTGAHCFGLPSLWMDS